MTTAAAASESGASQLEPISPELALVDPDLARSARALLPDFPRAEPARSARDAVSGASGSDPSLPIPARAGHGDDTAHRRRIPAVTVAGWIVFALLLTLVARHEAQPGSREPRRVVAPPTVTVPVPVPPAKDPDPASATTAPATPSPASEDGQTFVWPARRDAAAYEFQLFRREQRIFRARRTVPRLDLPLRWRQNGRLYELTPGEYRWYVWPISRRTGREQDVAIVQAKLLIEAPQE
jgi:hypothetical protein